MMDSGGSHDRDTSTDHVPPSHIPPSRGAPGRRRPDDHAERRAGFLVDTLGVTHTASLLGVSKSQPSRWRSGAERPSPAKARELVDLDHVVARASLLWAPDVVHDWLEGPNPHLDGARPVDVVRVRGSAEVLSALDAEASGAFG